jgi:hypothetical protein
VAVVIVGCLVVMNLRDGGGVICWTLIAGYGVGFVGFR